MPELWEATFTDKGLMWGLEPTRSAIVARDAFSTLAVTDVLIPGVGYGRNAKPFLDAGMSVTGIEISKTAIELARTELGLQIPIHHGSVTDMPFDQRRYGGIYCFGLLYLLDAEARAKVIADCHRQLEPGGQMVFVVISKQAPQYGSGTKLGDDWYEPFPGVTMYFYDDESVRRDFARYGSIELSTIDEPAHGRSLPFLYVACTKSRVSAGDLPPRS